MEEPITARAVRGDVLATAVVQGASATRSLAAPAKQISLQQWDGGFAEKPTEPTVLYSEKLAAAANPGDALGPFTFDSRLWIDATRVPHSFDALRVRFGLSSGYPLATLPPGAAQDAEVLRVGRQLQAERQVMGRRPRRPAIPSSGAMPGSRGTGSSSAGRATKATRMPSVSSGGSGSLSVTGTTGSSTCACT